MISEQEQDRYYLNNYGIYRKQYDKARDYAIKHWSELVLNAQPKGMYNINIADQLVEACHISYKAASDIAMSISLASHL